MTDGKRGVWGRECNHFVSFPNKCRKSQDRLPLGVLNGTSNCFSATIPFKISRWRWFKFECSEEKVHPKHSCNREFLDKISVVSTVLKTEASEHVSGMPLLLSNVFIPVLPARRETLDTHVYRNNASQLHVQETQHITGSPKKGCKTYASVNRVSVDQWSFVALYTITLSLAVWYLSFCALCRNWGAV